MFFCIYIYICSRFKVNSKHYAVALLCNNCHANIKHIERERERERERPLQSVVAIVTSVSSTAPQTNSRSRFTQRNHALADKYIS